MTVISSKIALTEKYLWQANKHCLLKNFIITVGDAVSWNIPGKAHWIYSNNEIIENMRDTRIMVFKTTQHLSATSQIL